MQKPKPEKASCPVRRIFFPRNASNRGPNVFSIRAQSSSNHLCACANNDVSLVIDSRSSRLDARSHLDKTTLGILVFAHSFTLTIPSKAPYLNSTIPPDNSFLLTYPYTTKTRSVCTLPFHRREQDVQQAHAPKLYDHHQCSLGLSC